MKPIYLTLMILCSCNTGIPVTDTTAIVKKKQIDCKRFEDLDKKDVIKDCFDGVEVCCK